MPEPSIPPSARRLREAWRAGVRPRAPWLGIGCRCLALWLVLAGAGPVLGRSLPASLRSAWRGEQGAMLGELAAVALAVVLALVLADVFATILAGALGPMRARAGVGEATEPVSAHPAARAGLAGLALVALTLSVTEAVAGAARGVDASAAGLEGLYLAWLQRALALGALWGLGLGTIERLMAERRRYASLHLTPDQAREEQRRAAPAGGRG